MILVANLLAALAVALEMLLTAYLYVVVAAAVVTWVSADPWNPIVRFLRSATEPVYFRLRRALPFLRTGSMDFAPLVLLAAIIFVKIFLVGTLSDFATHWRYQALR